MDSRSRDRIANSWLAVTAVSLGFFLAWFAFVNRDGCWLFWHGIPTAVALFLLCWIWFAFLFGFKLKGRVVQIVVTIIAAMFLNPHATYVATAESRAVGQLRRTQFELKEQKVDRALGYPERLAGSSHQVFPESKAFKLAYTPIRSTSGMVDSYVIQATSTPRNCGCIRSFAITPTGEVHYTSEARAATPSDPVF
jgi:hypothetical protein